MQKVHFIGICGAGMSAVAKLLIEKGVEVTGSDEDFYPPISDYLKENNIPFFKGYSANNIPKDADIIVIGKHAKLTPKENNEVQAAYDSGITIKSFPEILSELTKNTHNILSVGSLGKSTTSAMIAFILNESNVDASYFIGAVTKTPQNNAHIGKSKYFVLEGDEYPSSNVDIRSKFLHYHPTDILLTSLSHDHINIFETLEDYLEPYKELLKIKDPEGILVASLNGRNVTDFIKDNNLKAITYSVESKADWTAKNINLGSTTTFDLYHNEEKITSLQTTLLGLHNIENIIGVSALLLERKLVSIEQLQQAVYKFKSLRRRLDLKSEKTSIPIYEGFGSSYDKAVSAIEAIRLHFKNKRLVVIFEPHTFSWRNQDALVWYDTVFEKADTVFIGPPPSHGESTHKQLTHSEIINRVSKNNKEVFSFQDNADAMRKIEEKIEGDEVILLLSSGNLYGLIDKIPKFAEEKFPLK
jgi:UDP-N-acetylmuramate: L-alanyl-gamma-D-glutamyl-meso-diaminopimelate ligase